MYKMWAQVLATRSRRCVACMVLACILLTVQVITHQVRQETVVDESLNPQQLTTMLKQDEETFKFPIVTPKGSDLRAGQIGKARGDILKNLSELDIKQLQKVQQFVNSAHDPQAVEDFRIDQALQSLKVRLLEEISGQKFPAILDAATRGQAISDRARPSRRQIVISTTWRSGSTFLEELLSSHPAVYNHYEPLMQFGLRQIREGQDSVKAQNLLHDLLACRYKAKSEYMKTALSIKEMFTRNVLVWQICSNQQIGDSLCYNDAFLKGACQLFPWSTMKIVRLRLKLLRPILEDSKLNARIVYLVRDPRGVMNSRYDTVKWCHSSDCNDPSYLCSDMDDDLTAALELRKDFPDLVYILRYEDMSLSPVNKTKELLDFLGLDFDPKMQEFLDSHTTKNYDKPWSTSRDSKTRVTYWASKLQVEKLKDIQDVCTPVMKRFGYLPVNSTKDISLEKILEPLSLP
ncbi:carbohydrate sulfotransferase 5-like isoform X2 [Penaeus japonicus]|nr:carbohydrate sulfotransferase 5-like isoform X2 [Penaeus japonicus]XP_042888084.1 carbohydrate sulfotransferase 5-like isoform X2 [Penaeus japonicus]